MGRTGSDLEAVHQVPQAPGLGFQLAAGAQGGLEVLHAFLVRVSGENVGNYAIQQGGLGLVSGNYDLAYQGNNLTITKALLNVIADAKTKVYGDADPSLTYQVSGTTLPRSGSRVRVSFPAPNSTAWLRRGW